MANSNVKVKVNVKTENLSKPSNINLRPIQIVQPVEFQQNFSAFGQGPKYENPTPEVTPVKCNVRRTQNVFFILSLLLFVAAVVLALVPSPVKDFISSRLDLYNGPITEWKTVGDIVLLVSTYAVFIALISIIIRWIFHPTRCKAKKGIQCCFGCEVLKYFWTYVLATIVFAALFVLLGVLGFDQIYNSSMRVINDYLANGLNIAYINGLSFKHQLPFYMLIAATVMLLALIIATIAHVVHDKKEAKLEAQETQENKTYIANKQTVGYTPNVYNFYTNSAPVNNVPQKKKDDYPYGTGIYEEINSPYNMYKERHSEVRCRRGSKLGAFFKVVLAILVLVVAYGVVAYFIPALPLHDFVTNLF